MVYVLEGRGISKRFGGVQALYKVDFFLRKGEILAVVGDNGAGKSTLIKIFAGDISKDEGEIFIDGVKVEIENHVHAKSLGIEVVYQDLSLIDHLNVFQNLFLGRELQKDFKILKVLDKKTMGKQAKEKLALLGINLKNPMEWVTRLSGGEKQSIAVARAASWGKKIIILDEPTAAFGVEESGRVLQIIKELKTNGISVIIITHNMEHAFSIADRFCVLRLGRVVGNVNKSETNIDEVVKMITGGTFVN